MKNILFFLTLISIVPIIHAYELIGAKWPGTIPAVEYYINEEGCEDVADEWYHIKKGFDVWDNVGSSVIECRFQGKTPVNAIGKDNVNLVKWSKGGDWNLGPNVVGVAYLWWNASNVMEECDIELNSANFNWSTIGENDKMDIGAVVTHEVGHALGLEHSDIPDAVMWPTIGYGDTTNRNLHADDIAGITALYPRNNNNNYAPKITSEPITEAIVGLKYSYPVIAEDYEGDIMRFSLSVKPLNMRIDTLTGVITWYPKFLDLGTHNVIIWVTDEMGKSTSQSFNITVSDLLVYTVDRTVDFLDTLYYEVYVTPMDEYSVIAGNIELSYNNQQMVILDVDTVGSIIAGNSFVKNITASSINVAFAGSEPFTGSGVLFRIKMMIYEEHCGKYLELPISKAFFNDGDPEATTKDATVLMFCGEGYLIDGKVLYCGNNMGVGKVNMELLELSKKLTTTDDGFFAFKVPRSYEPYTITADKDSGDIRDAITAYDASLVLRYVVGLHNLTTFSFQDAAADVNSNGMITAYDAALILRFIVQYNDATNIGKWVLIPSIFQIPELLDHSHANLIYAYMYGDVSGNWDDDNDNTRSQIAAISMSTCEPAPLLTEKETIKGYKTDITLEAAKVPIYSGEVEVTYASDQYTLHKIHPMPLLSDFLILNNELDNKILIAFAGTSPLLNIGKLFTLEFVTKDTSNQADSLASRPVISSCLFNEYREPSVSINNSVTLYNHPVISQLKGLYPNPFVSSVKIDYSLSMTSDVSMSIYDLKGRELRNLINGKQQKGHYTVYWDGKGQSGNLVSSQVFIVKFRCGNYTKNMKFYKVR